MLLRERTANVILATGFILFIVPSANLLFSIFWNPSSVTQASRLFSLGLLGEILAFVGVLLNGVARSSGPPARFHAVSSPTYEKPRLRTRSALLIHFLAHFLGNAFLGASLAVFGFGETLVVFLAIVVSTAGIAFGMLIVRSEKVQRRLGSTVHPS